jgi:ABC-type multidrug transport system ATPase subunit
VGIARAVVHAPALLLADEPTGNLHSTQAREIMELFCQLNRAGTTIVQVTHSEENARYGKRILELRDGWVTRDEASSQGLRRLEHSESSSGRDTKKEGVRQGQRAIAQFFVAGEPRAGCSAAAQQPAAAQQRSRQHSGAAPRKRCRRLLRPRRKAPARDAAACFAGARDEAGAAAVVCSAATVSSANAPLA